MVTEMAERRPFCECLHSYWSHRVGRYNVMGRLDLVNGKLRHVCERQGCRCIAYKPTGAGS